METGYWPVLKCEICEETLRDNDEVGEFFDPAKPEEDSKVAHAQCGLSAGMEVA